MTATFDWGRMLASLSNGLMSAGSSPQGWAAFGPGMLQGQQAYDSRLDSQSTRKLNDLRYRLAEQEAEDQRDANSRKAAEDAAWKDFITGGSQPGTLGPGLMSPPDSLPVTAENGGPGGTKIYPGGPHDAAPPDVPGSYPHPGMAGRPTAAHHAIGPGLMGGAPIAQDTFNPLAGLTPQQRQLLAALPPDEGRKALTEILTRQPDKPTSPINVGGVLVDPNTYQPVADFSDVLRRNAEAGRAQTTIQLPPEQDAGDKELGKLDAQTFTDLQKAALLAPTKIANYDRLGALLQKVGTGKFTGTMVEVKKALAGAGIDPTALGLSDNMAAADAARPIINELALSLRNPSGGAGMPGALSDADRNFLMSSVPNLETSPDAVPLMVEFNKRLAQREREVAKVASDYRKAHGGHIDAGMYDAIAEFADAHPLFTPADAKKIQALGAAAVMPRGGSPMGDDSSMRQKYNLD